MPGAWSTNPCWWEGPAGCFSWEGREGVSSGAERQREACSPKKVVLGGEPAAKNDERGAKTWLKRGQEGQREQRGSIRWGSLRITLLHIGKGALNDLRLVFEMSSPTPHSKRACMHVCHTRPRVHKKGRSSILNSMMSELKHGFFKGNSVESGKEVDASNHPTMERQATTIKTQI